MKVGHGSSVYIMVNPAVLPHSCASVATNVTAQTGRTLTQGL